MTEVAHTAVPHEGFDGSAKHNIFLCDDLTNLDKTSR